MAWHSNGMTTFRMVWWYVVHNGNGGHNMYKQETYLYTINNTNTKPSLRKIKFMHTYTLVSYNSGIV